MSYRIQVLCAMLGFCLALSSVAVADSTLVGYWNFDEGTGDTTSDASGNGNTGTLINGPAWVDGRIGKALEFDGVDDYVIVPDSPSLDISGDAITFMAWVYSSAFQHTGWIMGKEMIWWIYPASTGHLTYGIVSNTGWTEKAVLVGLQDSTWYHVAVVYNGSYMRLYVNGVVLDSIAKTGNLIQSDNPFYIGLDGFSPSNTYRGLIDEVKVYRRALSAEEIKNEISLVGYWKFEEGTGDTTSDASGNGNTGTLINGPAWVDGWIGKALEFDGVDDYVVVPDAPSLDLSGDAITFMARVYSSAFQHTGWIMGKEMIWWIYPASTGHLTYGIVSNTGWTEKAVLVGLQDNTWYHVAVVYDGSYMRLYLNGVVVDSATKTGNLIQSDNPFYIGLDGFSPSNTYRGLIDEVKVYRRALSAEEIINSACSAKPGDANASGTYTLSDVIAIVNYIFNKPGCSPQPLCWISSLLCRGDWDGNTAVSLSDVIRAVNYIFNKPGGPWNALPSGVCCL